MNKKIIEMLNFIEELEYDYTDMELYNEINETIDDIKRVIINKMITIKDVDGNKLVEELRKKLTNVIKDLIINNEQWKVGYLEIQNDRNDIDKEIIKMKFKNVDEEFILKGKIDIDNLQEFIKLYKDILKELNIRPINK